MCAAFDEKGRTVLDEPAIQIVSAVLSALRHKKVLVDLDADLNDTREVLTALAIAGYAVIPQGAIDAMRKLLVVNNKL